MKKLFTGFFLFICVAFGFANGRFVKMNMKNAEDSSVINTAQVSEKSEIIGNIKQTTVELIITNSSNRILEGEFEFPLEENERVCGFALDINGKMRSAVAIEKEKGRQVFEDVVRKNVDPGLVEMTEGNNFKTRIYPIPANGFRTLRITYEKELAADSSEVVKNKVFTKTEGKKTYFYYFPDMQDLALNSKELKLPKSIAVYFDVSSSAENRNLEKEYEFIKKYAAMCGKPSISCVVFSNTIHDEKSFKNADELIKFLKEQKFDGGTNLNLDFSKQKENQILLFSDGIHNFGTSDGELIDAKAKTRVTVVNSSSIADFGKLKEIADDYVNLCEISVEKALENLKVETPKILNVEYNDKEISEVYPKKGDKVTENFSFAGILNKKSGKIKIDVGYEKKVLKTFEIEVSSVEDEASVSADNVARLWAAKKIACLSESYDANKDEIISLAKQYTIVTKDTSLIVLDSVQDYVRYGITPPDELMSEYKKLTANQGIGSKESDGIPDFVYKNFKEYKKWWKKSPKDFNIEKKNKKKTLERDIPIDDFSEVYDTLAGLEISAEPVALSVSAREVEATNSLTATASIRASESAAREMLADLAFESEMFERRAEPETASSAESTTQVTLQAWSSDAEYLSILKKTATEKMYDKYLELKKTYKKSPSFYMEVSDYFYEEGLENQALRILSNLAELNLENSDVLRALGNKLVDHQQYKLAIPLFEKLTKIRSEIPQFYRDLGIVYSLAGEYQKAADSLWKVASTNWDSRYNEIQQVCLNDMNAIIANHPDAVKTDGYDKDLLENFDVDIRIILTWNTDDCDVDLWVTDPDKEKCYYGYKLTKNGGRMSRDFTRGYGPEEFAIHVAPKGKYRIQANYYGNHQQKILQPVVVQAEVYTNFGRKNQTRQVLTLQLDDIKQTFDIGEIEF